VLSRCDLAVYVVHGAVLLCARNLLKRLNVHLTRVGPALVG
jgi:hypothetical protein